MIFGALFVVVLLFGMVVFFGAPYLPTMKPQSRAAIEMIGLKPGDTIIELGSGDGRVARRMAIAGYRVVGYELNPILVIVSIFITWKYRKNIRIVWGNFWKQDWPEARGVYVFLLDRYMQKLNMKLESYASRNGPVRVASYAFKIPDKKPRKHKNGVYLYQY